MSVKIKLVNGKLM